MPTEKLQNSHYYICQLPPVAQGWWRSHLSQGSTEPASLASLKTIRSPQSLFSLTVRIKLSHESSTMRKQWDDANFVAVIASLARFFINEVLIDTGWNHIRKLNRPKSSVSEHTLPSSPLYLDPAILPSFLLWPWYLSTSSPHQIQEINLLEDNTFLFLLDFSLCFSSDELLRKFKPSWIHSAVSHPADWKILPCKEPENALFWNQRLYC